MDQGGWTIARPKGWPANCQIAARYLHDWGDVYLWEAFLELEGNAYLLSPVNSASSSELQQLWLERIIDPDDAGHWTPNDFQPVEDVLLSLRAAHNQARVKESDTREPHLRCVA